MDDYDACDIEFAGDPGVGVEVYPRTVAGSWLCCEEVVQLYGWLGELIGRFEQQRKGGTNVEGRTIR